jgi:hypothetical protein
LVLSEEFNVDGALILIYGVIRSDGAARGLVGWGTNELKATQTLEYIVVEDGMPKITKAQREF